MLSDPLVGRSLLPNERGAAPGAALVLAADLRVAVAEREMEIARLRAELALTEGRLHQADQHIAELTIEKAALSEALAKANDRIKEFEAVVQRRKKGRKAQHDKGGDSSPPPKLDDDAKKRFDDRPRPPDPPGRLHDHPKPRPRPTGRKPLPDHLGVDEETVLLDGPCACGCSEFRLIDVLDEEKLTVHAYQRRRRVHRQVGQCCGCGKRRTAVAPPAPFPRSKVTCEWLGWFVAQKFQLFVPLDRLRQQLHAQGVVLAISFFVSMIHRAARLLDAIDGEHWKDLLSGCWLATDATGLKVQVRGVGLHHGHVEVYHRDDVVVFQYEPEKGGQTQSAKLAKFAGTLLVDAESRYNQTSRDHEAIIEANCNAHPRRKLRDAEIAQPVLASEGGRFVSAMFDLEREAKGRGLTGEALLEWRQNRIKPLFEQFRIWMDAVRPALLPSDPLAKVIEYYRNHWKQLACFLGDSNIEMDNSGSERLLAMVAKLRLNSMFAGSTEGAHSACVLLGISATCKRLGVDLLAYLTWVFIRVGTHREKYNLSAKELTPASYLRSISDG